MPGLVVHAQALIPLFIMNYFHHRTDVVWLVCLWSAWLTTRSVASPCNAHTAGSPQKEALPNTSCQCQKQPRATQHLSHGNSMITRQKRENTNADKTNWRRLLKTDAEKWCQTRRGRWNWEDNEWIWPSAKQAQNRRIMGGIMVFQSNQEPLNN